MLLNEIFGVGAATRLSLKSFNEKNSAKKVQPVKRIAKAENETDVKKKPVSKKRIDVYA